jgi:hypothetical protein
MMLAAIGLGARLLAGKAVSNAKRDWAAIPPKVKLVIAGLLAAIALYFVHQHYAHKAMKVQYDAGYAQATADIEKAAKKRTEQDTKRAAQVNQDNARSSQEEGNAVDQARSLTNALAADLLLRPSPKVRGHCAAVGAGVPGASAASGGPDASGRAVDDGVVELTRAQWEELIRRAAGKDVDSEKLTGWQRSYARWWQAYQGWLADQRDQTDSGRLESKSISEDANGGGTNQW